MQNLANSTDQLKVTDYFESVCATVDNELSTLAKENSSLNDSVNIMTGRFCSVQQRHSQIKNILNNRGELLKRVMQQCLEHAGRTPRGHRFKDDVINRFCMNVWILGGRRMYEILHGNLQDIFPDTRSIQRKLSSYQTRISEDIS